ncbi:MAG: hypothetical protein AAFN74_08800, partial [Myxococcota bacterium]
RATVVERANATKQRKITPTIHRFMVRPGVEVAFDLPADLTQAEARRLAHFVVALPFDWSGPE